MLVSRQALCYLSRRYAHESWFFGNDLPESKTVPRRVQRLLPASATPTARLGDRPRRRALPQGPCRVAKTDLQVLDDWGLAATTDEQRRDLLEILDEITTPAPVWSPASFR
jgi:hypothetical protein